LSASWQGAIIGLLLLTVIWFGRRWSSQVHYALLLVALIKFAVPPLWSSPTGLLSYIGPVRQDASEMTTVGIQRQDSNRRPSMAAEWYRPQLPVEPLPSELTQVATDTTLSAHEFEGDEAATENKRAIEPAHSTTKQSPVVAAEVPQVWVTPTWRAMLMLLHVSGITAVIALIVWQLRSLRRLVLNSRPANETVNQLCETLQKAIGYRRQVRVLQNDAADSPIAFGVLCPTILLPT
jgi:hypothetical protein